MDRFVIISGCSGGGKSTLLAELKRRGFAVVEEPGRRVIANELSSSGDALPWVNLSLFAERAVEMSLRDRDTAKETSGLVFFDRGLIDAAAAMEHSTGQPILSAHATKRYNQRVFMTPPWLEIYVNDADRRHSLQEAISEYERLVVAFTSLDYVVDVLPKVSVTERADIIVERLNVS